MMVQTISAMPAIFALRFKEFCILREAWLEVMTSNLSGDDLEFMQRPPRAPAPTWRAMRDGHETADSWRSPQRFPAGGQSPRGNNLRRRKARTPSDIRPAIGLPRVADRCDRHNARVPAVHHPASRHTTASW